MQTSVRIFRRSTWFSLSLLLLISPTVVAETQWQSCAVPQAKPRNFAASSEMGSGDVYVEANNAVIRDEGDSLLSGDAFIAKDDGQYSANSIKYNRLSEVVTATGNVKATTETMQLNSQRAQFNLKTNNNVINNATYQMFEKNGTFSGRGTSKAINQFGEELSFLNNATYTTCPSETPSWHIESSKIKLDHKKEYGTARNVVLKVSKKNIPVFYFPYFTFPLSDERKSGFLLPSYTNSSKSGLGVSLPYYFNLAPNYDYTFTPQYLTKRGLKLNNEFRYLTDSDNGVLQLDVLADDNERSGDNRYYYNLRHFSHFGEKTALNLTAEGVSDVDYFDDFGNSLESSSRTALKRQLDLTTVGKDWNLLGRIQNYQLLDGGTSPYVRLPQIVFNYNPSQTFSGLNFSATSELVNFAKQNNTANVPTGTRFDLDATVSKNYSNLAYFLKPSLTLKHTQYNLDLHGETGTNSISRTLPTISVDSGLFFERNYDQGKKTQTLEPRLFYTHTPYKDQSNIPIFDTSENSFRYDQLFSENRFSGKDRVEDTNRLSASLTSRILDQDSGRELFSASVGQIYHFADRNVTLPGGTSKTDNRSELALEFAGNITKNTKISSTSLWEADATTPLSGQLRLNYNDEKRRSIYSTYRYRKDSLEQLDLGFVTPVKNNWSLIGSWNHDIQNERILENRVGVEYKNCCIKSRIVARKYLTSDNNTYDNAIFMEFAFKGLGEFTSGE